MFRNDTVRLNALDYDLNPLGSISRFSSLSIKEDFFGVGSWEAQIPLSPKAVRLLKPFRLVEFNTDQGLAGIVDRVSLSIDAKSQTLQVGGPLLDGLTSWRLAVPDDNPNNHGWDVAQGRAGAIMAHYVDTHLIRPENSDRRVPNLEVACSSFDVGENSVAKGRFNPVNEILEDLGRDTRTGWCIKLQRENISPEEWKYKMLFEALDPVDRTNGSKRPVILSLARQNLSKASHTSDCSRYYNAVYALGEGEYEDRFCRAVGEAAEMPVGLFRREIAVDCGNEEDVERLKSVALQKISDMLKTDTLSIDPLPEKIASGIRVGDVVAINIREFNLLLDMMVSQKQTKVSQNGESYGIMLGNPPNTLTGQIKRYERLKTTP